MDNEQKLISPRVVIQVVLFVVVIPFLPLLISFRWQWWEAWVYAIISVLGFAISRLLASRRHPGLLAERAHFTKHENTESWDRILGPMVGLGGGLIPLVAGLDALFDWSLAFNLPLKLISLLIILAGYGLSSYALIENRFFSGVVRLQKDRGHYVVSSGPYHWIRHPGYAGGLLAYFAVPVFLDAALAFLPAVFLAVTLVMRTKLEDMALQDRLEGYSDYAKQVKYRLLPGVW